MKGIPILLISLVIAGGCIHTPAKVASEVPGVLKNVSGDVNNITDSIERNISFSLMGTQAVTVEQTSASIKLIKV